MSVVANKNPCINCGACCSFFRVSFYAGECISVGGTVPDNTVEQISPHLVAMIGTDRPKEQKPRCIGLTGTVGKNASCGMYEQRSTPCRDFDASFSNGVHQEGCDKARQAHGLKPLTIHDWN